MNKTQNDTPLLVRDGTGQDRRLPEALRTTYVQVDERAPEFFDYFARQYANLIRYYNEQNKPDDTWEPFFPEEVDPSEPHYALYRTFVSFLGVLQKQVNQITQRHLDFFYEKVLRLSPKAASPDKVHMLFELAKNVYQHPLKAGTLLKAGKDETGIPVFFKTERDLIINKGKVASLKTVFKAQDDRAIYAAPFANSQYSLGQEELDEMNPDWPAFGFHPPETFAAININREPTDTLNYNDEINAKLGFAVASPILWLQKGERVITLQVTLGRAVTKDLNQYGEIFTISYTTEEGWWDVPAEQVVFTNPAANDSFTLTISLTAEDLSVIPYAEEIIGEDYDSTQPMLRVLVTNMEAYEALQEAFIKKVDIDVTVTKVRELLLQSDEGIIDPNKPFRPYGGNPELGTGFYVGYPEAFHKKLDSFNINLEYKGITEGDLTAYYSRYFESTNSQAKPIFNFLRNFWKKVEALKTSDDFLEGDEKAKKEVKAVTDAKSELNNLIAGFDPSNPFEKAVTDAYDAFKGLITDGLTSSLRPSILPNATEDLTDALKKLAASLLGDNSIFSAQPYYLDKKNWVPMSSSIGLFNPTDAQEPVSLSFLSSGNPSFTNYDYERDLEAPIPDVYDVGTSRGFIKLELNGPEQPFLAFGHKEYTPLYTESIITRTDPNKDDEALPNEPYTPVIKSISLDYTSSISVVANNAGGEAEKLYQVGPFGHAIQPVAHTDSSIDDPYLLPHFENRGNLYVGLQNIEPGNSISLLFRVSEGTGDGNLTKDEIEWSVLTDNFTWEPLRRNVLGDSTNDFLNSGIISFAIPETATTHSTLLGKGYVWLRGTVARHPETENKLVAIHAQAVTAEFMNMGNDPNRLGQPLPAGTVEKLDRKQAQIKKVIQPYASFGGRKQEADESFYTRASERLRHKNRAITLWDYERLVLDEFPSVYKVKCLNHTNRISERAPGYVTLVIVSNLRNQNAVNPLKPLTSQSTLEGIKDFLLQFNSPFLSLAANSKQHGERLIVQNPDFEEIRVNFKVRFHQHEGLDIGYQLGQLEQAIIRFLAPWAYDQGVDIVLGGRVHKSMILNFVENLEYVDFVACFEMFHYVENQAPVEKDEIVPARSSTILVPHPNHTITHMASDDDCGCESDPKPPITPERDGIGVMIVQNDFEVN